MGRSKNVFNLLKSKWKRDEKEVGEKKAKDIELKIRKSSLKRFGSKYNKL